jgi:hypothetical protein
MLLRYYFYVYRKVNFQKKHDDIESKIQNLNSEIMKFNYAT